MPRSPGLRTRSRRSRASAKPMYLTLRRQSVVRGLRRDGWHGRARQTRTQPGGEVSDQFGFISEVGHFSGRRNGAPAECSGRKMAVLTVIADVLAGRSLAAYCCVLGDRRSLAPYCGVLPVRSIAGYCWFMAGGASRHPAGVSWARPVCGRSRQFAAVGTQRNAPRRCSPPRRSPKRISAAEWSGLQSWRVRPGRGRNRADTWQRKCRLGEAGRLSFPDEERSDEVWSVTPPQKRGCLWSECLLGMVRRAVRTNTVGLREP